MNSENQPIVELVKYVHWERPNNEFDEFKHYKDKCLVRVRNGQGRFVDGVNHVGPENGSLLYRCVSLDGQPLVQMRDTEHPGVYGYGKISPGAGLEHIDCEEMRRVSDSFPGDEPYQGFQDAFGKLKPLFSLMHDGYYMLVDTYMCPTDGGNRIFWDIDGTPGSAGLPAQSGFF